MQKGRVRAVGWPSLTGGRANGGSQWRAQVRAFEKSLVCVGWLARCADTKFLRFTDKIVKLARGWIGMTIAVYSVFVALRPKRKALAGRQEKAGAAQRSATAIRKCHNKTLLTHL